MGVGGVGGRREEGERATDESIESQNSHKQSFLLLGSRASLLRNANAGLWSWNFTDVTDSTVTSGRRSVVGPAPSLTSDG